MIDPKQYCKLCDDWYENVNDCFHIQQTGLCAFHYREDRDATHKKNEEACQQNAFTRGFHNVPIVLRGAQPKEVSYKLCEFCANHPVEKPGHTMCRYCKSERARARQEAVLMHKEIRTSP